MKDIIMMHIAILNKHIKLKKFWIFEKNKLFSALQGSFVIIILQKSKNINLLTKEIELTDR